mgnify:CR=1 FL=1
MARPWNYNPVMQLKADHYVTHYADQGDAIPSLAGLAVYLGVGKTTLHRWATDDMGGEFACTIDAMQCKQEQILLNCGLDGSFNAGITKVLLSRHGYRDNPNNQAPHQALEVGGNKAVDTTWNVQVRAANPIAKDNVNEDQNGSDCKEVDPPGTERGDDRDMPNSNASENLTDTHQMTQAEVESMSRSKGKNVIDV